MKNILTKRIRQLVMSSLTVFILCFVQGALAHTTLVPNVLDEGARVFASVSISHGCDGTPVRAQAVVFPGSDGMVEEVGVGEDPNVATTFGDHLQGGLHSSARLTQDKDVFRTQTQSELGGAAGFHFKNGYLQVDLTGQIPVRYSTPTFQAASCAKKVDILIPIANWCSKSATAPDRVDVWMGRLTAKFNDPTVQPVGFWPRITVHRDMANNPLDAACGDGIDLEWSPTDAQIDELLPIEGYWPANAAP